MITALTDRVHFRFKESVDDGREGVPPVERHVIIALQSKGYGRYLPGAVSGSAQRLAIFGVEEVVGRLDVQEVGVFAGGQLMIREPF